MEIELRPLNLGEVLDRTIQIYRSRFRMFAGIASFGAVGILIWRASQFVLVRLLWETHPHRTILILNGVLTIGLWIFGLFVLAAVSGATYCAVADIYTGKPAGVGRSYAAIRRFWARYISLGFISMALLVSPISILFGIGALKQLVESVGGEAALAVFFTLLGAVLPVALAFSLWFGSRYALAGGAFVFEHIGIVQAFRRSAILAKGQRLRIVIVLALIIAVKVVIGGVFSALFVPYIKIHHYSRTSVEVVIAILAVDFIARILADPVLGIGWMVCYFDARIRQEGFDVEWLLERSTRSKGNSELKLPVVQPESSGINTV